MRYASRPGAEAYCHASLVGKEFSTDEVRNAIAAVRDADSIVFIKDHQGVPKGSGSSLAECLAGSIEFRSASQKKDRTKQMALALKIVFWTRSPEIAPLPDPRAIQAERLVQCYLKLKGHPNLHRVPSWQLEFPLMTIEYMGRILDAHPGIGQAAAARRALEDSETAKAHTREFRANFITGQYSGWMLSYEAFRMLQIMNNDPSKTPEDAALSLVEEMRENHFSKEMPFVFIVWDAARMIIREDNPSGLVQGGELDPSEMQVLVLKFRQDPVYALAILRDTIKARVPLSERSEYVKASVALECILDSAIWKPDGAVQTGMPTYLMHNFYDLGHSDRERSRVDKFRLFGMLVDIRRKVIDAGDEGQDKAVYVSKVAKDIHDTVKYDLSVGDGMVNQTIMVGDYYDNGKGVCRHHAALFSLFMQEAGIVSRLIKGRFGYFGGRHAANLVRIAREWNFLDVTNGLYKPSPVGFDPDSAGGNFSFESPLGDWRVNNRANRWCIKSKGAEIK
jgi:hypothetical protein